MAVDGPADSDNPAQPADYVLTDLGTLGGAASSAKDINNRGEIIGWSDIAGDQRLAVAGRSNAGFERPENS